MKNLTKTQAVVATALLSVFLTVLAVKMAENLSKTLEILAQ